MEVKFLIWFKSDKSPDLSFLDPDDAIAKHKLIGKLKDKKYRCMVKDKVLFNQMMESLNDYIQPAKLKMLWHKYNTTVNKGLNYSVAMFAPKNFNFSGSMSLSTRVSLAVGIHLEGHANYWKQVLSLMDILIYESLFTYLQTKYKGHTIGRNARHNKNKKLKRLEKTSLRY